MTAVGDSGGLSGAGWGGMPEGGRGGGVYEGVLRGVSEAGHEGVVSMEIMCRLCGSKPEETTDDDVVGQFGERFVEGCRS